MQSWSNPQPSDTTLSALSQQAQIQPTHIGEIMSAIMHFRQAQAAHQQENFNNMLSGIAKGVSGGFGAYEQRKQQEQADDAANAAIYGAQ